MNASPRSLQLFFIDGRPDGMLTAEVFNWTGHVLRIPRTQIKEGLARPEAQFTGVYVLLGEQDGTPLAYVGEAEDMRDRLRNHAANKDWWDTAILITTSANNLHKAHVRYLEARLIAIAREVGAMPLDNGNQPSGSSLSEADSANMESFIATLMMVLPAIRVDNFLVKKRRASAINQSPASNQQIFECVVPRNLIHAVATLIDGEWVMKKGSKVRNRWEGPRDEKTFWWKFHDDLVERGIIVDGELMSDYAFSSPSAAASIATGRSANGRKIWKTSAGQTYADWEAAQLAEASP